MKLPRDVELVIPRKLGQLNNWPSPPNNIVTIASLIQVPGI
jgi:hypothetical protein